MSNDLEKQTARASLYCYGIAIAFFIIFALTRCSTTPSAPVTEPEPVKIETPSLPTSAVVATPNGTREKIRAIAAGSSCAKYKWQDRGTAPAGYIEGMALAYARSLCRWKSPEATVAGITGKELGDIDHDALTRFGLNPDDKLLSTWALGIGLGMRESSGKYCEGRDMSASNTGSETAEAGPFQASWNSRNASSRLVELMNWYKVHPEACNLEIWKQGVDANAKACRPNYGGSGQGLEFQKLERSCPAFAAEWAMPLTRVLRQHFGPLKILKGESKPRAEYRAECVQMLEQVKAVVSCE